MPNILHFNFWFYDWCRVCWMLFLFEIAVHRIQPPYANITGWNHWLFSCPPNVAQFQIRISSDLFSRTIVIWKCKCHYFLGNFLLYISDILYPPFSPCVCLDRLAKKKCNTLSSNIETFSAGWRVVRWQALGAAGLQLGCEAALRRMSCEAAWKVCPFYTDWSSAHDAWLWSAYVLHMVPGTGFDYVRGGINALLHLCPSSGRVCTWNISSVAELHLRG